MQRALAILLSLPAVARAASPTVAVMPFRDLSRPSSAVGEAIRETVTTDLKHLGGVRVVERGSLERILAEQHLQAERSDLDASTAARVGRLLGATLIVAGAYQEVPPLVRLTARFVNVESGEIVGTAKVDGKATDLLRLEDRVTAELLRSAGLAAHAKRIVERSRPDVKPTTMELYGQSVVAENDETRHRLLVAALDDDQSFSYAVDDLAALEKRVKQYQASADLKKEEAAKSARAQLRSETDPQKIFTLTNQIFSYLVSARRYHALAAEARACLLRPAVSPTLGTGNTHEIAGFYLVLSEFTLHDDDAVLRDGEAYLRNAPQSIWFGAVKSYLEQVIRRRRDADDDKAALAKSLAEVPSRLRWDLCHMAFVYRRHHQNAEAQRLLRACIELKKSTTPPGAALLNLIYVDADLGDFDQARRDVAAFAAADPAGYRKERGSFENLLPGD